MANKEIHELITAEELSSSDVIAEQRENSGTWLTRKLTFNSLGLFLNKILNYASDLHTTSKTIIGAINELAQGSGQSLDTLNDVDIDSQTLADGQGIVYDATAQKWKNGMVGGGHTYSTTEQVVGTWIDGSPVYEKSFSLTSPAANASANIIEVTELNIDKLISLEGNINSSSNSVATGNSEWRLWLRRNWESSLKDYITCFITFAGYASQPCVITIRYTKSST